MGHEGGDGRHLALQRRRAGQPRAAADKIIAGWKDGSYNVSTGPISDQSDKERVAKGDRMKDADILVMDWYVKGVQS